MKVRKQMLTCIASSCCFFVLILDSKTAVQGALDGIWLCINTVVPSLFPFFVISTILNKSLIGRQIKIMRPIGDLCGIPRGAESLLLLGILGGYPVGAQSIYEAYKNGSISEECAKRLLGFCNNAGPAFVFGMAGSIFEHKACGFFLWGIIIISTILTGILLPKTKTTSCKIQKPAPITIPEAIEKSLKSMVSVCAWVMLFKVILSYLDSFLIRENPTPYRVLLINALELSNGCITLSDVANQGVRFIICAGSLAFGGLCVSMQTLSVVKELGAGMYFPGKLVQSSISVILAHLTQRLVFSESDRLSSSLLPVIVIITLLIFVIYIRKLKNNSGNLISNHV